jgi:hypothetical protein
MQAGDADGCVTQADTVDNVDFQRPTSAPPTYDEAVGAQPVAYMYACNTYCCVTYTTYNSVIGLIESTWRESWQF